MPQQLTDMDLTKVSAVDRGANGKRFAVLKREGEEEPPAPSAEHMGLLQKIAKALGFAVDDDLAKAQTFAAIISGEQLSDALYDAWSTLQSSMWSAIWAVDADGADLSLEAKKLLVAQNLDEFKAWLMAQMETGIAKGAGDAADAMDSRTFSALVRKVGKKISAARMARLQEAADALASVLAEVESEDSETQKRAEPEEVSVTSEELAAISKAFTDAIAPIATDVAELKKAAPAQPAPVIEKAADEKAEGDAPATLDDVMKALGLMADRIGAIEKRSGVRQSASGGDAAVTDVAKRGDRDLAHALLG